MAPRPLFVKLDVYSFVDNRKQRVKEAFNQLSDADAMDEAVTQKLKNDCSLKVPSLRVEDQYATTRKIKVEVRNQVGRMFVDRSKPIMEDATEVTVHIPFDGDPVIFDVAPSASNSTRVMGEIVDQEVRFLIPLMRPDFDLPASVNREVSQINWRLDHLRFNADMFNADLEHAVKAYVAARRKKMEEHDSIVGNLGIPVRQATATIPTESLRSASKPDDPPPSAAQAKMSQSASRAPRALLSYSWDGPEHMQWVKEFAGRLQGESGVEIIFDEWHLNPGDDKLHFMERAVAGSDFAIVVCTPTYAERANKREGGVGYESMVITSELAEHILTNKFIPVLRKGPWGSSLPTYLKSRMGVNLSDEPYREDEYERLLRVLHGEPIQPPPIGSKPDFSKKSASVSSIPDTTGTVPDKASSANSLLGPPDKRPNAMAWARYDKPGVSAPWVSAHVRLWDIEGKEQFSFETSRGDEYLGAKEEVINRFFVFHSRLLKEGYKRMNFSPGPDPDFRVLT